VLDGEVVYVHRHQEITREQYKRVSKELFDNKNTALLLSLYEEEANFPYIVEIARRRD